MFFLDVLTYDLMRDKDLGKHQYRSLRTFRIFLVVIDADLHHLYELSSSVLGNFTCLHVTVGAIHNRGFPLFFVPS